jgi:hypothetical protein
LISRNFQDNNLDDFFAVTGVLRLSSKYFVGGLRTKAIQFLTSTWSYTLEGHDAFVERATSAPEVDGRTFPYVHPLHVVNLARETNVRILVPPALYFLSLYPLSDILSGKHPKLATTNPSAPPSTIAPGDFTACALLSQHRIQTILDFVRGFCGTRRCTFAGNTGVVADTMGVDLAAACNRGFANLTSRLSRSWSIRTGSLYYIAQAMQEVAMSDRICDACKQKFRHDAKKLRKEIWDGLPAVFGSPGWDELIALDLPAPVREQQ